METLQNYSITPNVSLPIHDWMIGLWSVFKVASTIKSSVSVMQMSGSIGCVTAPD